MFAIKYLSISTYICGFFSNLTNMIAIALYPALVPVAVEFQNVLHKIYDIKLNRSCI